MLPFALALPSAFASPIAAPATIGTPDSGPATPDPAAIHYNPAAMGASNGVDAMFDLQLSKIDVAFQANRTPAYGEEGIDPNTGEKYALSEAHVLVPVGLIGITWKPMPGGALGFAITDSFVGGGDYSAQETDAPPYTGSQRYAGIKTQIITVAFMPALAVTPIDGFHLGGGVSYVLDRVSLMKASDPLGSEGRGVGEGQEYAYDVILSAEGSGSHVVWNAGIFIDRWKLFQVGASYSSAGTLDVDGTAEVTAPDVLAAGEGDVTIPGDFSFKMPLPPVIRAGVASQINEKLRVGAAVEYYLWRDCCGAKDGDARIGLVSEDGDPIGEEDGLPFEVSDTIYSPRRLWNSLVVSGNGGYFVTPTIWAGLRVGYKQYAVPDYAVSATNLDFDAIGATLAARYRIAEKYSIGLSYTYNYLFPREITNSAWDVRDEDDADYVDDRFTTKSPYNASGNGTYTAQSNIFGLRLQMDL